jgi:coproporphyrinogen III oxidase
VPALADRAATLFRDRWSYDRRIEPGSREAEALIFLQPRDWL